MKLKILQLSTLVLFFLLIVAGCDKENNQFSSNAKLFGTWKFFAFGETGGSIENAQPDDCEECYILTFNQDSTMLGKSVFNTLGKGFYLSGNQLNFPNGVLATEILEEGDPLRFTNALENVHSFKIEESQLKLFYSDDDFLLFDSQMNLP